MAFLFRKSPRSAQEMVKSTKELLQRLPKDEGKVRPTPTI